MTEVLDPPVTHPVHAAFDDLVMAFDVVASTDLTALSATDLIRLTDDLVTLRRRADAAGAAGRPRGRRAGGGRAAGPAVDGHLAPVRPPAAPGRGDPHRARGQGPARRPVRPARPDGRRRHRATSAAAARCLRRRRRLRRARRGRHQRHRAPVRRCRPRRPCSRPSSSSSSRPTPTTRRRSRTSASTCGTSSSALSSWPRRNTTPWPTAPSRSASRTTGPARSAATSTPS